MSTGWLIYRRSDASRNGSFIEWFLEEAEGQSVQLEIIFREDLKIGILNGQQTILHKGKHVPLPDFAVVRTIDPMLSLHLESLGIAVFNPAEVSRICNDKALTHHAVHQLGIPMVDTVFMRRQDMLQPPLLFPFIVKEVSGRGGKQVYWVGNEKEWNDCVSKCREDVIIQSTDVQKGKDLRVFIVGKEIVGAVLRESGTDYRANYTLGGTASLYPLDAEEKAAVNKILDAFDFGMAGIDFLIGRQGELLFNEIEDVVGSRTLSACSDVNILKKYVSHIKSRLPSS